MTAGGTPCAAGGDSRARVLRRSGRQAASATQPAAMTPWHRLIQDLDLRPHPEGGWYRETWRAATAVATDRGARSAGTAILYLLADDARSAMHRIRSDEVWFHHQGGGLRIHVLDVDGARTLDLDRDRPQQVVPAGAWFGAEPTTAGNHVLVGCTVAPGFDFADFELATAADLAPWGPGPWQRLVGG